MFNNTTLRLKLFLLTSVASLALLVAIVTGTLGIQSGVDGVEELGRKRLPSVAVLQGLREAQIALRSSTYETGLWENDPEAQEMFDAIAKDKKSTWARIDEQVKTYDAQPKSADENEPWRAFLTDLSTWRKSDQSGIALIE